jgi:hypothetical protein
LTFDLFKVSMCFYFKISGFIIVGWLFYCTHLVFAEPTPKQLVSDADRYRGYTDSSFTATLEITSLIPDKEPRSNRFALSVKGLDSLVKFESPARDKGKAMLFKHRELWFHVPRTKRLIRLTPTQRLLGEASNGDVAGTRFSDDYEATLSGQESVNDTLCYVLEMKAVDRKVTYASLKFWISVKNHRPVRSQHFALSGKLLKTVNYLEFSDVSDDDKPKLSKMVIDNPLKKGQQTILIYRNWKKVTLPSSLFQKNYLKRLR